MIDFDKISEEDFKNSKENELVLFDKITDKPILDIEVNLVPYIEASENLNVTCRNSANKCLTLSLQARKIRNSIDKSRLEILKPHQNFIKSVNKQAKDYEEKLIEIEKNFPIKFCFGKKIQQNQKQKILL